MIFAIFGISPLKSKLAILGPPPENGSEISSVLDFGIWKNFFVSDIFKTSHKLLPSPLLLTETYLGDIFGKVMIFAIFGIFPLKSKFGILGSPPENGSEIS